MFLLVFRKKINTVILIHKGKLVFLRTSDATEQKIKIKVLGMVPSQWTMAVFSLIYSTSIDTGSGSFSEMRGQFNKCELGFLVDLPQAWTTSRLQSKVNGSIILYLTADTLAQPSLLNFCLMQNGRNIACNISPSYPHLIERLVQQH